MAADDLIKRLCKQTVISTKKLTARVFLMSGHHLLLVSRPEVLQFELTVTTHLLMVWSQWSQCLKFSR